MDLRQTLRDFGIVQSCIRWCRMNSSPCSSAKAAQLHSLVHQPNPTTTHEVPQEPKGCAVIAGGSTVTTRRHATASGCCTPVIIFFAISIILVSILVSTVTTLSNATALGRTGPSLWQVDGQFFDAKALDLVSTR